MQQREQHMLKKLSEARERQARAMNRVSLAQARISLAEERLQIYRERLQSAQKIPRPDDASVVPSSAEARQDAEDEATLIAAILAITQTEPGSQAPATNPPPITVQQAEDALGEAKQAILHDTLNGPEAENALSQVRPAETEAATNLEADTSSARDTSETDTTARLPVIRPRRPQ